MNNKRFETKNLILIPGEPASAKAAYQNQSLFSEILGAQIPKEWPPELLADVQKWTADTIAKDPVNAIWWAWYVVLKGARNPAVLIGSAGFKGPPTESGVVEIGYAILDEFQRHGYGSEAATALISWAFEDPRVTEVIAETFPDLHASIKVMEKNGMIFVGSGSEPGVIRYSRKRSRSDHLNKI